MEKFRSIMVGLNGESTDSTIMKHVEKIRASFDIKKSYFVHIAEDLKTYESLELRYPDNLFPLEENIKKILIKDLESAFKDFDDMEYEIIVKDGDPGEELLRLIDQKQIDLLILGRKPIPGISDISRLLVSQASCSVIFVPKTDDKKFEKILVPMDFSSISKQKIQDAFTIKKGHEASMPVQFYSIPKDHKKTGNTLISILI